MIRLRYKIFLISLDVIQECDKIEKILLVTTQKKLLDPVLFFQNSTKSSYRHFSSFVGFLDSETWLESNQIKVKKLILVRCIVSSLELSMTYRNPASTSLLCLKCWFWTDFIVSIAYFEQVYIHWCTDVATHRNLEESLL